MQDFIVKGTKHKIIKAQTVEVIKIVFQKGEGTKEDPVRLAVQYWDLNGNFIQEIEPTEDSLQLLPLIYKSPGR